MRRLTISSGAPVAFTKGEYSLVVAFLEAPQRPLTREHLSRQHAFTTTFNHGIDVQILRLRRKLETDPRAPRIIQIERGAGNTFPCPSNGSQGDAFPA